jgi:hypothetical protein
MCLAAAGQRATVNRLPGLYKTARGAQQAHSKPSASSHARTLQTTCSYQHISYLPSAFSCRWSCTGPTFAVCAVVAVHALLM